MSVIYDDFNSQGFGDTSFDNVGNDFSGFTSTLYPISKSVCAI